jgi:soluble lytic murein transglycosylase-like protein
MLGPLTMRKTRALLPLAGLLAVGAVAVGWYRHGPPTVPAQYRSVVLSAAATCPGLNPRLLAAQIEQESGWDAGASSRAGAQGIAQFLPSVWRQYAVDGDGDGIKNVWDAADAIASAAHLDCVLLREVAAVPGDPMRNMLAAYNAGPAMVRRYGGVPPFRENRAYVELILARSELISMSP